MDGRTSGIYLNRKLKVLESLCDDFSDLQVLEVITDDKNVGYKDRLGYCVERLASLADDIGLDLGLINNNAPFG